MAALVLLSGGQDSATVLGIAARKHKEVHSISFHYGQRHEVELLYAEKLAAHFKCKSHICIQLNTFEACALTDSSQKLTKGNDEVGSNTEVPGRNLVFLSIASSIATTRNIDQIYFSAMYLGDGLAFTDCSPDFVNLFEETAQWANLRPGLKIVTPIINKTKAESFEIAEELGFLDVIIKDTMTCFEGDETLHDWGRGCGKCPACELRKQGWEDYCNDTH